MEEQDLTTKTKKKKWLLPAIVAVIVVISTVIGVAVYNLPANRINRQLALAEKYMSELNYEAAIIAYKAAIEIDSKCEDAYIELVDLYIAMEAYDKAEEVINTAALYLNSDILLSKSNTLELLKFSNDSGIEQNTDIDEDSIQTNDLTFVENEYIYNSSDELILWSELEYDKNEQLISHTSYDSNNNIIYKYNYDKLGNIDSDSIGRPFEENVYDEMGKLVKIIVHNTATDITVQYWKTYSYDENNNMINVTTFNSDGSVRNYSEYIYDKNNNTTQCIDYYSDNTVQAYHDYDTYGNEISLTRYNQDGSKGGINYIYEYNSKNQLIKKTGYESDDTIYDWTEYIYDSDGNKLTQITYNNIGQIGSFYRYEYDSNGNCITEEHYTNYNPDYDDYYITNMMYDKNNRILEYETLDRTGNVISRRVYSYDYR